MCQSGRSTSGHHRRASLPTVPSYGFPGIRGNHVRSIPWVVQVFTHPCSKRKVVIDGLFGNATLDQALPMLCGRDIKQSNGYGVQLDCGWSSQHLAHRDRVSTEQEIPVVGLEGNCPLDDGLD